MFVIYLRCLLLRDRRQFIGCSCPILDSPTSLMYFAWMSSCRLLAPSGSVIPIGCNSSQYDLLSLHSRTLSSQWCYFVGWQLVASEATWSQSDVTFCTYLLSDMTDLYPRLYIDSHLSVMVHHHVTIGNQCDRWFRLTHNVGEACIPWQMVSVWNDVRQSLVVSESHL